MTPQEQCDQWNRDHDSGVIVEVWGAGGSELSTTRGSAMVAMFFEPPVGTAASIHVRGFGRIRLSRVSVPTYYDDPAERFDYTRAGGKAVCEACGLTLDRHPEDLDHPSYDGKPFLVRRCDGSLVKL